MFRIVFILFILASVVHAEDEPTVVGEKTITNTFQAFTGKVTGNKVRLRSKSDLDSPIVRQLSKGNYLLIVGETHEFYAVEPPFDTKTYIFRSYVIDNIIEADRVNVRLHPDTESPIIGQLQKEQRVYGSTYAGDNKWLEISPPQNTRFYVAKEYISHAGDVEFLAKIQKRQEEATKLLNSAYFLTQAECKKPFNEMTTEDASAQFEAVVKGYSEFNELVQQAKDGLALLQDNYLQKKIAFLETKGDIADYEKEKLFSNLAVDDTKDDLRTNPKTPIRLQPNLWGRRARANLPTHMNVWIDKEKELFEAWSSYHQDKLIEDFYLEQKVNSQPISGIVEKYDHNIKNKPGNFFLKKDGNPTAFLYSTTINLEEYIGKEVDLLISYRENNHFAFPAFFVNSVQ